jgi:hypothetical protein
MRRNYSPSTFNERYINLNKKEYLINQDKVEKNSEKIERLKEEKMMLHERIKETENEIRKYTQENKRIVNKLLHHYHKLLNDGMDTRAQGLSWVIKSIFMLDSKVIMSHFPKFLDEQAIKFLFEVHLVNKVCSS